MITAIIQARMSSRRLPGKVLLPLGDTTVLGHTIRQVKKARSLGRVLVATSDREDDNAIAAHCSELGVDMFRGSLDDVLDRYYRAAKKFSAEHVCRVTADCPLIDPAIIDRVATEYQKGDCDYISTGRLVSTFPDGMDVEVFSFAALERAWREAQLPPEREHVTPYIWNHPERFRVETVRNENDLSKFRLTLDEADDYILLQHLVANVPSISMQTAVTYLETHPDILALNARIVRDEGYQKSLPKDIHTHHESKA